MAKGKAQDQKERLYTVYWPDIEELRRRGEEFAHPRIDLGHAYGSTTPWFASDAEVEFQISLRPGEDGHVTNNGLPYAGTLQVQVGRAEEFGRVVGKALSKAASLGIRGDDEFQGLVVGLRALGWREAVLGDGLEVRLVR